MLTGEKDAKLDGMIHGSSKTQERKIVLFFNQHKNREFVDLGGRDVG